MAHNPTAKHVLVIGQGGREHAIVRQLARSPKVERISVAPGSDGMRAEKTVAGHDVQTPALSLKAPFSELTSFVKNGGVDLVVIGPEQPLADGLADVLRASGVAVFGPSAEGARLEASKIHAKDLMRAAGVKTARSFVVTTVAECMKAAETFAPPYVLKADGLAAGKGVFIEKDRAGLERAARALFEERSLGEAGARALLEEFSAGVELSHLVLTDGKSFVSMPAARDHKRLRDGDQGPNTGGMGVVAPIALGASELETIERDVVAPVIREIEERGIVFRGVLYFGLMMTDKGPSVLEFNTRFGDPEAQVLMALLDESEVGWIDVFQEIAAGRMPLVKWRTDLNVACLVLAAEGYPEMPVRDVIVGGVTESGVIDDKVVRKGPYLEAVERGDAYLLHAGTKLSATVAGKRFVTNGGRVLNIVSVSKAGLSTALDTAYAVAKSVSWPGRQMRTDIGSTSSFEG